MPRWERSIVPMCGHPRSRVFKASTSTATLPSVASTSGSNPIAGTSCLQRHAAAILAAHFSASSREGTSRIVIPPVPRARGVRPLRLSPPSHAPSASPRGYSHPDLPPSGGSHREDLSCWAGEHLRAAVGP